MERTGRGALGTWWRVAAVLATTAGALVVVATGAGSAGAATKAPVVIGDICSCTGPEASSIGQTTAVVQAWASWVNAHGGLDGHQVQVVVKDDGYSGSASLTDVTELIQQDHVVALFDNSDESPSWTTYVKQQQVPVLGGTETVSGYTNPYFFPPGGTFNLSTPAGSAVDKKYGVKKVADLYCVEVAICAQSVAEVRAGLQKVGLKLVYSAGISFSAPNYTAQCLAAKQSGATAMEVADASEIVDKVAETCAAQGYSPKELSADGTVAIAWLKIPAMQGNIDLQAELPWFVHDSATKDMYAALDKYASTVPTSPNFGEIVVQAWSAGALLQAAVDAGHLGATPTSAEILDDLYKLPTGTDLGGLSPPLHFTRGKPASNGCFFVMGINHQKFVTLNGGTYTCVK